MVLGICSFIPCTIPYAGLLAPVMAIILAIIALAKSYPRKGLAIAGLVTGIIGATIGQTLVMSLGLPPFNRARSLAKRAVCATHLQNVGKGIVIYQGMNDDAFPPALEYLPEEFTPRDQLICPSSPGDRPVDYFYLPPFPSARDGTIIACDFERNHWDYRNVLYADFSAGTMNEQEFRDKLDEPQNAAFAAALREAEGP